MVVEEVVAGACRHLPLPVGEAEEEVVVVAEASFPSLILHHVVATEDALAAAAVVVASLDHHQALHPWEAVVEAAFASRLPDEHHRLQTWCWV